MQDQPLLGMKEFCQFLQMDMNRLKALDRYVGVPHAMLGGRWVGTTHSLMRWLTRLVDDGVAIQYDKGKGARLVWEPDEEVMRKFGVAKDKQQKAAVAVGRKRLRDAAPDAARRPAAAAG